MSAYPIYQVDYYKNFREMLFGIAQKYAQKPAVTWYPRTGCAQTKSYRDLEMDAFLFAEALCAHGLQGKHIAIAAENSYEWVCAFLGIVACGSVAICIDAKQTAESMLGMAKCADAEMVLVSQRVAPLLCPLLLEADIQTVVMGAYSGVQSLEEFCSAGRESAQGKDTAAHCRIDGKQPAAIVFTAGTVWAYDKCQRVYCDDKPCAQGILFASLLLPPWAYLRTFGHSDWRGKPGHQRGGKTGRYGCI